MRQIQILSNQVEEVGGVTYHENRNYEILQDLTTKNPDQPVGIIGDLGLTDEDHPLIYIKRLFTPIFDSSIKDPKFWSTGSFTGSIHNLKTIEREGEEDLLRFVVRSRLTKEKSLFITVFSNNFAVKKQFENLAGISLEGLFSIKPPQGQYGYSFTVNNPNMNFMFNRNNSDKEAPKEEKESKTSSF